MDGPAPPGMAARRTRTARALALIALLAAVTFVCARDEERIRMALAGDVDEEPLVIYFRFAG